MKTKFYLSLVLSFFLFISCGLFSKKIDSFTEETKKNMEKKVLKEFGVDNEKREKLMKTGVKAKGEITKVQDTQETINNNPRVKIYVKVKPDNGEEFDAVISTIVSRVNIPRKGDEVTVFYDKDNKEDIIVE